MAYTTGVIHEENNVFGISFPDFPGCVSTAATLDSAMARGAQALALHIEGMIEDGQPLPALRTVDQQRAADPDWFAGGIVAALHIELPGKAVRVNVSIDENLLERIDRAAESAGQSRSAFIAHAAKARIALDA